MSTQPHKKAKRQYEHGSAERTAIEAVTPERYEKGYWVHGNARKMLEGSEERAVDSIHMRLAVPVAGLWSLVKPNAKRQKSLLEPIHIQAANAYHADLLVLEGSYNHEMGVFVDRSRAEPAINSLLIDAGNKIACIRRRMSPKMLKVLETVFLENPDKSLSVIWPNIHQRRLAQKQLIDAMHWIAKEYNLCAN